MEDGLPENDCYKKRSALTAGLARSRSRYSRSMRDSMRFLRSLCFMGNLSCVSSSETSSLWLSDLRVFITRTMAASICAQQSQASPLCADGHDTNSLKRICIPKSISKDGPGGLW